MDSGSHHKSTHETSHNIPSCESYLLSFYTVVYLSKTREHYGRFTIYELHDVYMVWITLDIARLCFTLIYRLLNWLFYRLYNDYFQSRLPQFFHVWLQLIQKPSSTSSTLPTDEGLWDILIKDIPKEVTSYTFNMDILKQGVSYDFRVIGVNDYGYGSPSPPSASISGELFHISMSQMSPYSLVHCFWPGSIGGTFGTQW